MQATESKHAPKGGYLETLQTDINQKMRGILLDWIVDVHLNFKLQAETLFMCCNLIERYLEKVAIPRS